MEARYLQERERQQKMSRTTGVALTVLMHVLIVVFGITNGFIYLDPPPPEQEQILIDFTETDIEKPRQRWDGSRPAAPEASKEINLVQQAEAQHEGSKSNEAQEATVDDFGDVDIKEPERPKEIDKRALFHAADNKTHKDTLAPQTSDKASDKLKAGHALGNVTAGETSGDPKANLKGRKVVGSLPLPAYGVQASGKVVVEIYVDNYGTVQKAVAGVEGTTVTDKTLWQAARKAALGAHFNMSGDAPALQKGTITYIFNLR